jgi:hypothetical protein
VGVSGNTITLIKEFIMISKTINRILFTAIAAIAMSGNSYADTLIGSAAAGWQTWAANDTQLNDNKAPYWDSPWASSGAYGGTNKAQKNVGFCMTSTGDCQGIGSALYAPGSLSFWGKPYNSATDTGGERDDKVYFKNNGKQLKATLYLNASAVPSEINEFGWFETNSDGTVRGNMHMLFKGSMDYSTGQYTQVPDAVGKTVTFQPTQYYGFYYNDVSEPLGALNRGCYAYTVFGFTEPRCLENTGGQGDHDFVVFSDKPGSDRATYWIGGEDPVDCISEDSDCNLTLVKVSSASKHEH